MTVRLASPKAILFDWDNTLVDSWGGIAEALNARGIVSPRGGTWYACSVANLLKRAA